MASIKNAAPRSILEGIQDASTRVVPVEAESVPMHLPHLFLFTERGLTEPQLVSGASAAKMYGAKSFDVREKYTTHQTPFANAMMVQRLKPADAAPPATIRVSLDLSTDSVKQYERNADGSYKLGVGGVLIETGVAPG